MTGSSYAWQLIYMVSAHGSVGQCCLVLPGELAAEPGGTFWHVHHHVSPLQSTSLLALSFGGLLQRLKTCLVFFSGNTPNILSDL
jgi:hypothetical protein